MILRFSESYSCLLQYIQRKKPENRGGFNSYQKIARTLPVITTSTERSFSSSWY